MDENEEFLEWIQIQYVTMPVPVRLVVDDMAVAMSMGAPPIFGGNTREEVYTKERAYIAGLQVEIANVEALLPDTLPDPAPTDPPHVAKSKADAKYPKKGERISPEWWRAMCSWFRSKEAYAVKDFANLAGVSERQIKRMNRKYTPRG